MRLTDEGLDRVEAVADKHHNYTVMLICQAIREIRDLKKLFEISKNTCNGCDGSASGVDDSQDKH